MGREPSNSKEVKDLRRRIFSGRRKFSRRLLAETEKKGKKKKKKKKKGKKKKKKGDNKTSNNKEKTNVNIPLEVTMPPSDTKFICESYNPTKYLLVEEYDVDIFATESVDTTYFIKMHEMVKKTLDTLDSDNDQDKFRGFEIYIITDSDPDLCAGHKNDANSMFMVMNSDDVCKKGESVWKVPVENFGVSIGLMLPKRELTIHAPNCEITSAGPEEGRLRTVAQASTDSKPETYQRSAAPTVRKAEAVAVAQRQEIPSAIDKKNQCIAKCGPDPDKRRRRLLGERMANPRRGGNKKEGKGGEKKKGKKKKKKRQQQEAAAAAEQQEAAAAAEQQQAAKRKKDEWNVCIRSCNNIFATNTYQRSARHHDEEEEYEEDEEDEYEWEQRLKEQQKKTS